MHVITPCSSAATPCLQRRTHATFKPVPTWRPRVHPVSCPKCFTRMCALTWFYLQCTVSTTSCNPMLSSNAFAPLCTSIAYTTVLPPTSTAAAAAAVPNCVSIRNPANAACRTLYPAHSTTSTSSSSSSSSSWGSCLGPPHSAAGPVSCRAAPASLPAACTSRHPRNHNGKYQRCRRLQHVACGGVEHQCEHEHPVFWYYSCTSTRTLHKLACVHCSPHSRLCNTAAAGLLVRC
jgi:hypothetical protein